MIMVVIILIIIINYYYLTTDPYNNVCPHDLDAISSDLGKASKCIPIFYLTIPLYLISIVLTGIN